MSIYIIFLLHSFIDALGDILKRWKMCYCVLKTNGHFSFYSNETMMELQGSINLPRDCFVLQVRLKEFILFYKNAGLYYFGYFQKQLTYLQNRSVFG